MQFLYTLSIRLYHLAVQLASVFNRKAALWVQGRKGLLETIALTIDHNDTHVWFHCASLGEFEQGRPVIERFRKEHPEMKIVLTFFSPSGFQVRKDYNGADYVFYMPLDTPRNARRFVAYLQPRLAVFVKYEYWFNHLNALHEQNIPVVFISAIFRKEQMFFRWWGAWFRSQLKKITYFFLQDKASRELLYSIGVRNAVISGDTRFDRVCQVRNNPASFPKVERFVQGSIIVMGGSTWPADEQLLAHFIARKHQGLKFILVPHEIDPEKIRKLEAQLEGPVVKYSEYNEEAFKEARVLIVDQVGMLSSLYQYASLALIGGGFGKGIHNILEAAAYGMPVIFGPNYHKFAEARELVKLGGAFPVTNQQQFEKAVEFLLGNYNHLTTASRIAGEYVTRKKGATDTILVFISAIINPSAFKVKAPDLLNMN